MFIRETKLTTAFTNYEKRDIKSTLKLLLVLLPVLGLLMGVGIGLIVGITKFEVSTDLFIKLGCAFLPAVVIFIFALRRYFNQIDTL